MSRSRTALVLAAAAALGLGACTASTPPGSGGAGRAGATASSGTVATGDATTPGATTPDAAGDAEIAAALEALTSEHGEYAALATYEAIVAAFGDVQPYANIMRSEQHHIDFLVGYLEAAGEAIPANPWTGQIRAPADLLAAAQAGIDAEIANVAMYDELLARDLGDDALVDILTRLRGMSEDRHLPAFEAALANGGVGTEGGMGPGGGNNG